MSGRGGSSTDEVGYGTDEALKPRVMASLQELGAGVLEKVMDENGSHTPFLF